MGSPTRGGYVRRPRTGRARKCESKSRGGCSKRRSAAPQQTALQWRPGRDAYLTEGSRVGNGGDCWMGAGWARGTWERVQPVARDLLHL